MTSPAASDLTVACEGLPSASVMVIWPTLIKVPEAEHPVSSAPTTVRHATEAHASKIFCALLESFPFIGRVIFATISATSISRLCS
jgi:hypothetical protein